MATIQQDKDKRCACKTKQRPARDMHTHAGKCMMQCGVVRTCSQTRLTHEIWYGRKVRSSSKDEKWGWKALAREQPAKPACSLPQYQDQCAGHQRKAGNTRKAPVYPNEKICTCPAETAREWAATRNVNAHDTLGTPLNRSRTRGRELNKLPSPRMQEYAMGAQASRDAHMSKQVCGGKASGTPQQWFESLVDARGKPTKAPEPYGADVAAMGASSKTPHPCMHYPKQLFIEMHTIWEMYCVGRLRLPHTAGMKIVIW